MDHLLPVQLVELQSIATDLAEMSSRPWPPRSTPSVAGRPIPCARAREAGLLGLQVPVDQGGLGQGLLGLCVLTEAIARACPSSALCYGMHCVATAVIAAKATDHQREHYLKEIAAGRHVTTLALSEQGTGAHFYLPETRLDADGEDFIVEGTKQFVTNGGHADSYVVSTVAAGAEAGDFSCLIVDKGGEGMHWLDAWAGFGMRGNSSRPLQLDRVRVPARNLLGEPGDQVWYVFEVVAPFSWPWPAPTWVSPRRRWTRRVCICVRAATAIPARPCATWKACRCGTANSGPP